MKRSNKWIVPRGAPIPDPRIAIAKHMGWTRPIGQVTEYSLPEPDNYNYAGLSVKPIECPFLSHQIFYQPNKTKLWWSVYYVTEENNEEFLAWSENIEYLQCWTPFKSTRLREQRPMLWTRANVSEQTLPERLYTMGYYDELQKEFNIDITNNLGKPRDNMPQGEFT